MYSMYTSLLEQRVGPRTAERGQTEVTCHSQPVPGTDLSRQLMAKSTFLITIVLYTPALFFYPYHSLLTKLVLNMISSPLRHKYMSCLPLIHKFTKNGASKYLAIFSTPQTTLIMFS